MKTIKDIEIINRQEKFNLVTNLQLNKKYMEAYSAAQKDNFTKFVICSAKHDFSLFTNQKPLFRFNSVLGVIEVFTFNVIAQTPKLYCVACRIKKEYYLMPFEIFMGLLPIQLFCCHVDYQCHYRPVAGQSKGAYRACIQYCIMLQLYRCVIEREHNTSIEYLGFPGGNSFSVTMQMKNFTEIEIQVRDKTDINAPLHMVKLAPNNADYMDYANRMTLEKKPSIDDDCSYTLQIKKEDKENG